MGGKNKRKRPMGNGPWSTGQPETKQAKQARYFAFQHANKFVGFDNQKSNGIFPRNMPLPCPNQPGRSQGQPGTSSDPWLAEETPAVAVGQMNYAMQPPQPLIQMNFQSFEDSYRGMTPMNPTAFRGLIDQFDVRENDYPLSESSTAKFKKLSHDIWRHFVNGQQKKKTLDQKISLWEELEKVVGKRLNGTTHIFGSTLNGFAQNASDMDLCLFVEKPDTPMSNKQHREFDTKLLSDARKIMKRQCKFIPGFIELIPAKVPILKFHDKFGNIEVDMSVNNPVCIRNTNLLFVYSQLDWRVRPLAVAVKTWAKAKGINEARNLTMSSYVLSLMVIHFLQTGVEGPPVLPSLQVVHPDVFHADSYIFELPFTSDLPRHKSENTNSLGELFGEFFHYYNTKFDFARDVGSVRTGKRLDNRYCQDYARANDLSPKQWEAYICMEEPFDRTNAGRAVVKRPQFDIILEALKKADQDINQSKADFQAVIAETVTID